MGISDIFLCVNLDVFKNKSKRNRFLRKIIPSHPVTAKSPGLEHRPSLFLNKIKIRSRTEEAIHLTEIKCHVVWLICFCGMTALSTDSVFNTTLFDEVIRHISECSSLVYDLFASAVSLISAEDSTKLPAAAIYDQLSQLLSFDESQVKLLKTFLFVQLFTLFLIFLSWKVYGKRISERFMTPGESLLLSQSQTLLFAQLYIHTKLILHKLYDIHMTTLSQIYICITYVRKTFRFAPEFHKALFIHSLFVLRFNPL